MSPTISQPSVRFPLFAAAAPKDEAKVADDAVQCWGELACVQCWGGLSGQCWGLVRGRSAVLGEKLASVQCRIVRGRRGFHASSCPLVVKYKYKDRDKVQIVGGGVFEPAPFLG